MSREPTTLAALLGQDLPAFTILSRKHGDGWGEAWYGDDGLEIRKAPTAAHTDPWYADTVSTAAGDLGLLHLRWATLGLPVVPANTHPFEFGGVAFCHNGSLKPPAALDALVCDVPGLPPLVGTTDSERYFRAILSRLDPDDPLPGVLATCRALRAAMPGATSNCILTTPTMLIAVRDHGPRVPEGELADYFQVCYRLGADDVLVASSGWLSDTPGGVGSAWTELPNGSVLAVERKTLTAEVHAL